jgi:antitoxin ParD1/3/4
MPSRSSLNVSLTPELQRFIAARVASGHYRSASEVMRAGLRLLVEREGSVGGRDEPSNRPQRPGETGENTP